MSVRWNLRHRSPNRVAMTNPCRTGCKCVIMHAVTPEDVARIEEAIVLARLLGETDLVGCLQERLNTSKCPAAQAQMEVR